MKTIKFYLTIAVLALITTSCVEKSDKYKAAIAQRDSLEIEKQVLDSNYNQTIALLNDIENGFALINLNENQMQTNLNKGVEGKYNKRELIAAQMTAIKETMEQNKAKIAELRQLEAKKMKANGKLSETIKRLQSELDAKAAQILSLQAELDQKTIKINELNTTVDAQNQNIAEQKNVMEQQRTTIKGQDKDINTVWYCIATSKELKEAKILTGGGLFKAKNVMGNEFDKNMFTQIDLRTVSSITTNSKDVKILSTHPKNSYNLFIGSDKNITIQIINSSRFWSISRYLVVQI